MKLGALLVLVGGSLLPWELVDDAASKSKPLSEIAGMVEQKNYVVVDASLDDGVWELEVYEGKLAYELTVDPKTGEILSKHRDDADPAPPAEAKRLSEILKILEKAGYSSAVEASFEHGNWEVEAYRAGTKRELRVDPHSGKVLSDRID